MRDKKVTFRLPNAMKHSLHFDDLCYCVDVNDDVVDEHVQELMQLKQFLEKNMLMRMSLKCCRRFLP